LGSQLRDRSFQLKDFTVADAYLFAVLNWSPHVGIALSEWPEVDAYFQRLTQRPSIGRALAEEAKLYAAEQRLRVPA
jgi:glutathione S-transferase